jgi:hypothetical protein
MRPLLAAEVVSWTKTWNEDFEVADPALPAVIAAAENANTSLGLLSDSRVLPASRSFARRCTIFTFV